VACLKTHPARVSPGRVSPRRTGSHAPSNVRQKESFTMPEVKLGLEAVLTIDGAEITNVKDLTVSLEKAEADASTRANNGWRATEQNELRLRCS
jgi:hypothetical protein